MHGNTNLGRNCENVFAAKCLLVTLQWGCTLKNIVVTSWRLGNEKPSCRQRLVNPVHVHALSFVALPWMNACDTEWECKCLTIDWNNKCWNNNSHDLNCSCRIPLSRLGPAAHITHTCARQPCTCARPLCKSLPSSLSLPLSKRLSDSDCDSQINHCAILKQRLRCFIGICKPTALQNKYNCCNYVCSTICRATCTGMLNRCGDATGMLIVYLQ